MSRVRAFCFVVNNYTQDEYEKLKESTCEYICFQKEVAPTTNTPHIQGYIYFKNPQNIVKAKKIMGVDRAHLIVCDGSAEENRVYCSKTISQGHDFFEKGNLPKQGKRNDITNALAAIAEGANELQILEEHPSFFCNYQQPMRRAIFLRQPKRTWWTKVTWLWGDTGTGKSHYAFNKVNKESFYVKSAGKWWDGYAGEEDVILEEYRTNWMTFTDLLRLCDQYAYIVETKGGSTQFLAKRLFITCSKHPKDMWGHSETVDGEAIDQLLRRITEGGGEIIHKNEKYVRGTMDDFVEEMLGV